MRDPCPHMELGLALAEAEAPEALAPEVLALKM
jgi:hypothetical protein